MLEIEELPVPGYERVVIGRDDACGFYGAIAVHSTALGPALGGVRMHPYSTLDDAMHDVLRLSAAMSRKNAISRLDLGGGKAVILGDPALHKTRDVVLAMGELIESLDGAYLAAEDAGMTPTDMDLIAERSRHVTGTSDGSGAPGLSTAPGVMIGIERAVRDVLGASSVAGVRVAVQGLGSVGWGRCELLHAAGAELIVADVRVEACERARQAFDATVVEPGEIHRVDCEVLSPCALGGVLTEGAIGELRCRVVAGGANNQFADQQRGPVALKSRGVEHAPDYVINAGGVIRIFVLDIRREGDRELNAALHGIADRLSDIWSRSRRENRPPLLVADDIADARIASGV